MQQQQAVDTGSRRRKPDGAMQRRTLLPFFQLLSQKQARSKMKKELATEVAKGDGPFVRSSSVKKYRNPDGGERQPRVASDFRCPLAEEEEAN